MCYCAQDMTATDSALSTYLHQETVKPLAEKKTKKKKKADPSPPAAEEKISQVILPRRKVQSPALVLPERETRKAGIAQVSSTSNLVIFPNSQHWKQHSTSNTSCPSLAARALPVTCYFPCLSEPKNLL